MVDSGTAAATLSEVERVRGETRERLDPGWVPYLVFGVLTMLSAPFTQIGEGGAEGIFWLVAGPVGLAITWLFYRRHELQVGLMDRQEYLLAGIVAAMVLGAILVGWDAPEEFSEAGWMFPIGAGLVAIGALESSAVDAGIGMALLVAAAALQALDPAQPAAWAAVLGGAILLAGGLVLRARGR
jgi:hypothetical protein